MSKRERRRLIRDKRKKLFLRAWREAKAGGESLSAFCRDYGLCRNNFYRWLGEEGESVNPYPIHRIDPALSEKAREIYLRYKGTWSAETVSLALQGRISPWSVRKAVRSTKAPAVSRESPAELIVSSLSKKYSPFWAVDWTEFKIARDKFFILLLMDEASLFWLGWEVLLYSPNAFDAARFISNVFRRYSLRPLAIKSDRAQTFKSWLWTEELLKNGIPSCLSRPHCPTDQAVIERGIRDVKAWLKASAPSNISRLRAELDEGIFILNFLKPRAVLEGRTPAAAYFHPRKNLINIQKRPESVLRPWLSRGT